MKLPKSKYINVQYEKCYIGTVYTAEQMKAFAQKAVEEEREACAKLCDDMSNASSLHYVGYGASKCAYVIRKRGTQ